MILAIHKTVLMFVALMNLASFNVPVTDEFCEKAQELMDKKKNIAFVIPDYSLIGRPIAVICLDPEAGE